MGGGEPDEEFIDTVLELLTEARRRRICTALFASDDDVHSLGGLVDQVIERERGRTDVCVSDEYRKRLASDLHHRHLPKLAAAGVIDYDARSRTVRYRRSPIGDGIRELLERIGKEELQLGNRDR